MSNTATFWKLASYVDDIVLAGGVAETITRPTGYGSCVITPNADIWLRRTASAAVPAADVVDGTGSVLIPAGQSRIIDFHDALGEGASALLASVSVICAGAAAISLEWFP